MNAAGGLALALASAFALNWGWVEQHAAARRLPALALRSPLRSLRSLFADLAWLLGFGVGLAGWAAYVAALALAPISLVQSVAAGGVGILALLAHRRGARLTRRHVLAVAAAVGGLALLGVSLAGGAASGAHATATALPVWLVVLAAIGGAAALRGASASSAATLGIAAGVLYAMGDVATKAATFGGAVLFLVPLVLVAHGSAFIALQLGFQRGDALATAGTATLLTNALPILAGVSLFHEHVPGGALGVLRMAGFAAVVVGAVLLTRDDGSAALEERDRVRGQALAPAGET